MHPDDLTPPGSCMCGCGAATHLYRHRRSKPPIRVDDSGCWIWEGCINKGTGYGYVTRGRANTGAHRWVYERLVGPIPDGLVIDHLCRVRACCNPAHMEPVTPGENTRRGLQLLSADDVVRLRRECAASDLSAKQFAKAAAEGLPVGAGAILRALNGSSWAHVPEPTVHKLRSKPRGRLGWNPDRPQCVECGTTEREHNARGYCCTCYQRLFVAPNRPSRARKAA